MRELKLPILIAILCFAFAALAFPVTYAVNLAGAESNVEHLVPRLEINRDDLWQPMVEARLKHTSRQAMVIAFPFLFLGCMTIGHILLLRKKLETTHRDDA